MSDEAAPNAMEVECDDDLMMTKVLSKVSISDSDEFDTDLDEEDLDEEILRVLREQQDVTPAAVYRRACRKSHIAPQHALQDSLLTTHVHVPHRNIGPEAGHTLAIALVKNTTVTSLDLRDNGLGGAGAMDLAQTLIDNEFITNVDLSDNQLETAGALAMADVMRFSKGLTVLNIAGNSFCDRDAAYLAIGIQGTDRIVSLDLSRNALSELGGIAIGHALSSNNSIEKLSLSWNQLRRKGAVAVCKGLWDNTCLLDLDVSWNGFGYEGALALGALLKRNHYLRSVDVSNNRVTWKGALLLAPAISENDSLDILRIGDNPLTTTGCMDLIEAVSSQRCGLKFLSLQNVPVIGEFELLATAIQSTRDFRFEHGGIIMMHDVLGERHDKRIDPMQRIIDYMRERGLRPNELFRSFDKNVSNRLTLDDLVVRLRKVGISLPTYDVQDLLEQIKRNSDGDDNEMQINYKNMVHSVKDQIEKERWERIRERERKRKLRHYHKSILESGQLPPILDETDGADGQDVGAVAASMMSSFRSGSRLGSRPGSRASSRAGSSLGSPARSPVPSEVTASTPLLAMAQAQTWGTNGDVCRPQLLSSLSRDGAAGLATLRLAPLTGGATPRPVMSMSAPLGAKSAKFGAGGGKTKKKKKKKSRKI